jgi:hypothetical protein
MEAQERQENTDQAEPKLLYHYTSQTGLLGIVQDKCLWATHSQFLNDLSEYRIVFDALQKKIKTERNDYWSNRQANMQSAFFLARQMKGVFVSSFSCEEQADSLMMWRGYSAPTGGYSIGFDRLVLNVIANKLFASGEGGPVELGKCLYIDPEDSNNAESLERTVESAWKESIERMVESASNDLTNALRSLPINIYQYVKLAALAKHKAFREENEWRVVIFDEEASKSKRTKFRQSKSMIVPYLEISWKGESFPNPIRRIVVGPTPNKEEATRAAEMLLERNGIPAKSEECPDGVEVVPSQIPYRNW